MKVELSLAQFAKLSRLSPESWKALLNFVQQGGSGDFSPDLHGLREAGLVQKVGEHAYIKFPIDGSMPTARPVVARKKNTNEFAAFMAVWRESNKDYMTGQDLAALKRFVNNYSLDEFKTLIEYFPFKPCTLHTLWAKRSCGKLTKAYGGDDD